MLNFGRRTLEDKFRINSIVYIFELNCFPLKCQSDLLVAPCRNVQTFPTVSKYQKILIP